MQKYYSNQKNIQLLQFKFCDLYVWCIHCIHLLNRYIILCFCLRFSFYLFLFISGINHFINTYQVKLFFFSIFIHCTCKWVCNCLIFAQTWNCYTLVDRLIEEKKTEQNCSHFSSEIENIRSVNENHFLCFPQYT